MNRKTVMAGTAALLILSLAGCEGAPPAPAPSETEATSAPANEPMAAMSAVPETAPPTAAPTEQLDYAALQDRDDPERLLRFYASAIQTGKWEAAAAAWSLDANVTPQTLQSAYGRGRAIKVAIGKGDSEGAAGTLFYEAPVTIQSEDGGDARRGTIVLRRANDVPGASEEQLNWRIERSSLVTNR